VYTPLQKRNLITAVVASNVVGLIVDSYVFLSLAGIPIEYMEGQVVGKLWMTALAIPAILWIRSYDERRQMLPAYMAGD
jgi:uncharacterized PurR-regulated membrane protein YhhQ (DUF165 family)